VAGPIAPLAIPTSLHASLLARLDRLAPTREVAQIGAALGRSFSYKLISAVAGMPHQKLDGALEQLASAELIFRRGVPPDAEYTFKHAMVQDAAYATLLRARRQQLHQADGWTSLRLPFGSWAQPVVSRILPSCALARFYHQQSVHLYIYFLRACYPIANNFVIATFAPPLP
jgi:hypothetical protein